MATQPQTLTTEQQTQLLIDNREKFELEHRNPKSNRNPIPTYMSGGRTFHGYGRMDRDAQVAA